MKWDIEIVASSAAEAARAIYAKVASGELPTDVAQAVSLRLAAIPPEQPTLFTAGPGPGNWTLTYEREIRITSRGSIGSHHAGSVVVKDGRSSMEMSLVVSYEDTAHTFVDGAPLAPLSLAACTKSCGTSALGLR